MSLPIASKSRRQGSNGESIKGLLLMSASLLALMAATPTAAATTFLFSGAIVDYTIPATGAYQIVAFGAQGGSSTGGGLRSEASGGKGAGAQGNFELTAGEVLQIVVGAPGRPMATRAGGGGGSLCYRPQEQAAGDRWRGRRRRRWRPYQTHHLRAERRRRRLLSRRWRRRRRFGFRERNRRQRRQRRQWRRLRRRRRRRLRWRRQRRDRRGRRRSGWTSGL